MAALVKPPRLKRPKRCFNTLFLRRFLSNGLHNTLAGAFAYSRPDTSGSLGAEGSAPALPPPVVMHEQLLSLSFSRDSVFLHDLRNRGKVI